MVLKNIKEIKNIEKKIIHRKISSSRYVRMIRFFDVFFFIFTSHNFKVMHNQLSKIFSNYDESRFSQIICGGVLIGKFVGSLAIRGKIYENCREKCGHYSVSLRTPLRAWQGRLDSMIFSPNNSGRQIYSFSEFCLISQVYLSS